MKKVKRPRRRYRLQGRDWHGWVCKLPEGELCHWAEPSKPAGAINGGQWVRVKFIEINGKGAGDEVVL